MNTNLDITSFEENGFFVLKNVLPIEAISEFQNILTTQFQKLCDKYSLTLNKGICAYNAILTSYPEEVSNIQRIICRTPEYFKLISGKKLSDAFKFYLSLNENDSIYYISNGIIFSSKFENLMQRSANMLLDWHNDVYFTIPKSPFIQMWAPLLEDATEENGALIVARGSHKKNILKQAVNVEKPYIHRYTINPEQISEFKKESIPVALGDVLIFDGRLVHASGYNNSDNLRCTMIGVIHNPEHKEFKPTLIDYKYSGMTPEEYFYENNNSKEEILSLLKEQAYEFSEPPGGV